VSVRDEAQEVVEDRNHRDRSDVALVLVILFGAVGLGALTGYLDYILMPVLAIFVGLTIYAWSKQKKDLSDQACCPPEKSFQKD
jgi:hypothetical protein